MAANGISELATKFARQQGKLANEAHPNSKIYDDCWDGYEKVPGKKRGEPGSCRKKTKE